MLFAGCHKVFDTVELFVILEILDKCRIDYKYSSITQIYENATTENLYSYIKKTKIEKLVSKVTVGHRNNLTVLEHTF